MAAYYHFLYLVSFLPSRWLLFPMGLGSLRRPINVVFVADKVDIGHTFCPFRLLLLSEVKKNTFEGVQVELNIFGYISGNRGYQVVCSRSRINVL